MDKLTPERRKTLRRWRLSLGRYAQEGLGVSLAGDDAQMDLALDYLYRNEYQRRGLRQAGPKGPGSLDPSQLTAPDWLGKARKLFPQSVYETLQDHALERYQLTEERAFAFLARVSQTRNVKLRAVAEELVAEAEQRADS